MVTHLETVGLADPVVASVPAIPSHPDTALEKPMHPDDMEFNPVADLEQLTVRVKQVVDAGRNLDPALAREYAEAMTLHFTWLAQRLSVMGHKLEAQQRQFEAQQRQFEAQQRQFEAQKGRFELLIQLYECLNLRNLALKGELDYLDWRDAGRKAQAGKPRSKAPRGSTPAQRGSVAGQDGPARARRSRKQLRVVKEDDAGSLVE